VQIRILIICSFAVRRIVELSSKCPNGLTHPANKQITVIFISQSRRVFIHKPVRPLVFYRWHDSSIVGLPKKEKSFVGVEQG